MLDKKDLVSLRGPRPDDVNFIFASWLRGLYYGDTWFGEIPKDVFMENYHKVVQNILTKADVRVACLKDDPDVILGYSVSSGSTLHWIFTKSAWRKIGIGKSLLPEKVDTVTHLTKIGRSLKPKDCIYNPFAM